jgi:hypothetical protein
MKTMRVLYHMALADFFERARRYSFLLILAAVIFMGVLVNNGSLKLDLNSGDLNQPSIRYRGEFNSAWIGTMTVMVMNLFLGMTGFYLINDCIKRDIRTGVGQIIATTPVSRAAYLIGKWLSNCLVLFVLVLILAVAAVIMVLLQGEAALDLGALLMPFLVVALPNMALTAALAVVFETVPFLRGALGNVVYFFLWITLCMAVAMMGMMNLPSFQDPMGYNIVSVSLQAAARAVFPNDMIGIPGIGNMSTASTQYKIFRWSGLEWTPGLIGGQWLWAVIGLGLILLSSLWFTRFDPSREGLRRGRGKTETAKGGEPARSPKNALHIKLPSLSPVISKLAQLNPFLGVLFAELRMLLNGRRWWWWAITIGLNVAIFTSPIEIVKFYLVPAAWLWPLSIWSGMGNRERMKNTSQMVFSSARPVLRQLPAAWLAGILTTALLFIAVAAFFISNGDLPSLAGWAGAIVFVPSLALALGVFTSGSRVFEVVYLVWWYAGPMSQNPMLDFTAGAPQVYLLTAAGLLLLSAYWRGKQVRV